MGLPVGVDDGGMSVVRIGVFAGILSTSIVGYTKVARCIPCDSQGCDIPGLRVSNSRKYAYKSTESA